MDLCVTYISIGATEMNKSVWSKNIFLTSRLASEFDVNVYEKRGDND